MKRLLICRHTTDDAAKGYNVLKSKLGRSRGQKWVTLQMVSTLNPITPKPLKAMSDMASSNIHTPTHQNLNNKAPFPQLTPNHRPSPPSPHSKP